VIPNYRRVDEALEAVNAVTEQTYAGPVRAYLVYEPRPSIENLLRRLPSAAVAIPFSADQSRNPIAARRNAGLLRTTEDIVAFLDDDDLWSKDKLSVQVEALQNESDAIACCGAHVVFHERPVWPERSATSPIRGISQSELLRSTTVVTSSVAMRGSLARSLLFDERPCWTGVEDYELWLRASNEGAFLYVSTPITALRVDSSSTSREDRRAQRVKAVSVLAEHHSRRSANRRLRLAAFEYAAAAAVAGPGSDHESPERLLDSALDGRLWGRLDRLMAAGIRLCWRSSRLVPALRRGRAVVATHRRRSLS
jgi:hypothetical protein